MANLDEARVALSRNWLVIAWIPVGLTPSSSEPVELSSGQAVNLVPNEHTILLHAYDSSTFWVYDPEPDPHLPEQVQAGSLGQGMSLFDTPALAVQPLT